MRWITLWTEKERDREKERGEEMENGRYFVLSRSVLTSLHLSGKRGCEKRREEEWKEAFLTLPFFLSFFSFHLPSSFFLFLRERERDGSFSRCEFIWLCLPFLLYERKMWEHGMRMKEWKKKERERCDHWGEERCTIKEAIDTEMEQKGKNEWGNNFSQVSRTERKKKMEKDGEKRKRRKKRERRDEWKLLFTLLLRVENF